MARARRLAVLFLAASWACGSPGPGDDPGPIADVPADPSPADAPAVDAPDGAADAPDALPDAMPDPGPDAVPPATSVVAVPTRLAFGSQQVGCFSQRSEACLVNTGDAPLRFGGFALSDTCPEPVFRVKNDDPLPRDLAPGAYACAGVSFAPQQSGSLSCELVALAGEGEMAAVAAVAVEGKGVPGDSVVDEFTMVSGQEVDYVLVVDDSPSMCALGPPLKDTLERVVEQGAFWADEYHLGVLPATMDPARAGRLNGGRADVAPRFLARDRGTPADLVRLGIPGCASTPDGGESAMVSLKTSFKGELGADYDTACATDAECAAAVCLDPGQCAVPCVDGGCRGFNAGFYRDTAQLEIVVVSDANDHGPGTVEQHVAFLKNVKGWYNTDMMHLHAVVMPVGGCDAPGTPAFDEQNAYVRIARETGGMVGSICDDWSALFNRIGQVSFNPKIQFFLTRLAEPASVRVFLDDVECATGWRYDAPSNSILFDVSGPCMPGPNARIRVEYRALCMTS